MSITYREWEAKKNVKIAASKRRVRLRNKAAEMQDGRCIYCQTKFTEDNPPTFEHIIPASRGGLDVASNCVASCRSCNHERGSRNHGAFLRYKRKSDDRA